MVGPDAIATTIHIAVPPRRRAEAAIKLAFEVPSIDDLRARVAALGGHVDSTTTEWEFRGFRRCDGLDPEGNVIQLLETIARDA